MPPTVVGSRGHTDTSRRTGCRHHSSSPPRPCCRHRVATAAGRLLAKRPPSFDQRSARRIRPHRPTGGSPPRKRVDPFRIVVAISCPKNTRSDRARHHG